MGLPTNLPALLMPLLLGLAACVGLLLILRLLRRSPRVRANGPAFLAAALGLGAVLALDGWGLLGHGWLRGGLVALLLVGWGYVIFDLLEDLLLRRDGGQAGGLPRLARDILRVLVLAALILLAVNRIFGVPLSSLVISSTVLSAVLGLALQDLLKDVIAGVALQVEQPYAPGDWLQIADRPARVVEMNWRATRLVDVDSTQLIVPNASMAQAQIINYSVGTPLQALHVQIALAPDHPPNQVKQVLTAAALAAEGVLADPPPGARLIAYGEYSVTYDIKFWMPNFDRHVETRDAVMTSAWYHIRRAGFRLPAPVRELYMHEADARLADEEERRRMGQITTTLGGVALLEPLSEAERAELAARAEQRIYGRGETLVRQGDSDDRLFIICSGMVRVEVTPAPGAAPLRVGELRAGDFFGELALLTGSPRRATVVAEEDTVALLVRREAIAPLLERNPALPEGLSAALERRLAQTRSALQASSEAAAAVGADMSQRGLLRRIRSLFGLE